jgi:hypothetical protein
VFAIEITPELGEPAARGPGKWGTGRVIVGQFRETIRLPLWHWTEADYKRYWHGQVQDLLANGRPAVLLTGPAGEPADVECCPAWILYREGNAITVQNDLLLPEVLESLASWEMVGTVVPHRPVLICVDEATGAEHPVSHWDTSLDEVASWWAQLGPS